MWPTLIVCLFATLLQTRTEQGKYPQSYNAFCGEFAKILLLTDDVENSHPDIESAEILPSMSPPDS
jgi:hypothetical protein